MGVQKPPRWVITEYWSEFINFVNDYTLREKAKEELEQPKHLVDWATLLGVAPLWEFWDKLDNAIYGESITGQEKSYIGEYLERREAVRKG